MFSFPIRSYRSENNLHDINIPSNRYHECLSTSVFLPTSAICVTNQDGELRKTRLKTHTISYACLSSFKLLKLYILILYSYTRSSKASYFTNMSTKTGRKDTVNWTIDLFSLFRMYTFIINNMTVRHTCLQVCCVFQRLLLGQ